MNESGNNVASDTPQESPMQKKFSANGKRLGIFVISYNAEAFIAQTLNRIPDDVWDAVEVVYVVDDCSIDDTTKRVMTYDHHKDKIVVFRNRTNRRYGGNQKFGYQFAIDRGLDAVVMLHGDGQYTPEMLPQMFEPIVSGEADIVIGSRMINHKDALKGGMPRYKFIANIALTKFENFASGMNLSEFHSGYRAYSTAFLKKVPFWENSDEWHFDSHILFQAKAVDARIKEIPIPTCYGDEVCHVNGVVYGLHCLTCSVGFRLSRWGLLYLPRYDISASYQSEQNRMLNDPWSFHSIVFRRVAKTNLLRNEVLDLGFGCAAVAYELARRGNTIDGVDHSPAIIKQFGELFRNAILGDINKISELKLSPSKYDCILALDILQYLDRPQDVLVELKKHIVRGGMLFVTLPNEITFANRVRMLFGFYPKPESLTGVENTPRHRYTLSSMKTLLGRTGWVVTESTVSNMPIVNRMPFLRRKVFRPILWLMRGVTLLMPDLFGHDGILVCTNPNESDML